MPVVPRAEIVKAYFWVGTAEEIAFCLNFHYRTHITVRHVQAVWAEEYEANTVYREAGERPRKGFPRSEKIELAERLVA